MDWNRTFKHLGEVSENQDVSFKFEYNGDKKYASHKTSCSCISSEWVDNTIIASYNTGTIPQLSKDNGRFYKESSKYLTIFFEDNTSQTLHLNCVIHV